MRPELVIGSLSADTKNYRLVIGVAFWVSAAGKIVEIVQDLESACSGDGSLILSIEDRVAGC